MKHARQKIREAVATALGAISGVTVYRSRVYPIVATPVISVFGNDEESSSENETMPSPRRYSRTMALNIEISVEAVSNYDDLADDFAAQVEAIIEADITLAGTATECTLRRTTERSSGNSDKPVAIVTLTYEVWYRTSGTDPETAL